MASECSSHWWLAKFAARLMQCRPHMSAAHAVQCAVASFHQAAHLDPEVAADIVAAAKARSVLERLGALRLLTSYNGRTPSRSP